MSGSKEIIHNEIFCNLQDGITDAMSTQKSKIPMIKVVKTLLSRWISTSANSLINGKEECANVQQCFEEIKIIPTLFKTIEKTTGNNSCKANSIKPGTQSVH